MRERTPPTDEELEGSDHPPDVDAPEDVEVLDSPGDMIEQDPLVQLFGDGAQVKVLAVLLNAIDPLNPSTIQERADIHHDTWYRVRDDLLETGLVEEVGSVGNSPIYAVPDEVVDLRVQWLQQTRDWTAGVMYHNMNPPTEMEK